MSEYETWLAYLWQSGSFCTHMIEVQVHRRILGISSWQIQHCIFTNHIWQSTQTRRYWVLVSKYETSAHLFVSNPQLLLAYHRSSGKPLIRIPESWKLRHRSGILGSNAALAAGVFLAYDRGSFTPEIFNPVQNELFGYVWSQLWQAASHYGWYHSSPVTPQERQISHWSACTCST